MELDIEQFEYIDAENIYEYNTNLGTVFMDKCIVVPHDSEDQEFEYIYRVAVLVDVGDEQGYLMPTDNFYTDDIAEAERVYDELVAHYNSKQLALNEMWYE